MPEDNEDQTDALDSDDLKEIRDALRRERARRAELESQLPDANALRRENLMLHSGIDTTTALGAMFNRGYEGELEPEAIKAEWAKIAPAPRGEEPPPEPTDREPAGTPPPPERPGGDRVLNSESSPPGGTPEADPIEAAIKAGRGAGNRGSDEAVGAYVQTILDAATKGDPRVMHTGVMDGDTRAKWAQAAHERQIRSRDQSKTRQ